MSGEESWLAAPVRILIVEDDFNIAVDMARLFKAAGAEIVGPAATVPEALALVVGGERIDGAVLDITLRGALVYPVADALRSKGVPVVFLTGYDEEIAQSGYRDIPWLRKPVAVERVMEAIEANRKATSHPNQKR